MEDPFSLLLTLNKISASRGFVMPLEHKPMFMIEYDSYVELVDSSNSQPQTYLPAIDISRCITTHVKNFKEEEKEEVKKIEQNPREKEYEKSEAVVQGKQKKEKDYEEKVKSTLKAGFKLSKAKDIINSNKLQVEVLELENTKRKELKKEQRIELYDKIFDDEIREGEYHSILTEAIKLRSRDLVCSILEYH